MPTITYPNQRTVKVHREPAKADFLGIKNENWQAACRDLRPHAFTLYLYLAANADNYTVALSPAAVKNAIGMARSTYHDQFHILVQKGYIVPTHGNTFEFYEKPQPRPATPCVSELSEDGYDIDNNTVADNEVVRDASLVLTRGIEINNSQSLINKDSINNNEPPNSQVESFIPKVKEIIIPPPRAERKKKLPQLNKLKQEAFEF